MSGRIFVTGDTHGAVDSDKLWDFAMDNPNLRRNDYLIILGDFGFIWNGSEEEKMHLSELEALPYTLLILDGNHENFDLLEKYEKQKWCGGTVQYLTENVIHLCRGQVYEILGKKFFVIGGATSIDKSWRLDKELKTGCKFWWPQENISSDDIETGFANLAAHDNSVDYVLTHCAPTSFAQEIIERALGEKYGQDINEMHLEDFRRSPIKFKHWYCGHYHIDYETYSFSCLYNEIIEI